MNTELKTSKPMNEFVTITANGFSTSDRRGNKYYNGYALSGIGMARVCFEQAKNFWGKYSVNNVPLELKEVKVQIAKNNSIPYNSPEQRRSAPVSSKEMHENRISWYNLKFNIGETGWICSKFYYSPYDANTRGPVDTLKDIYNDSKIVNCIYALMQRQK